ncbi:MAG: hypothetical protein HFH62_14720 [Lachnospiraceae bacterium]|nr:hypothetical protein [Lachnospiraceae bacterium]
MKKLYLLFGIVLLCICYASQGFQVTAEEDYENYEDEGFEPSCNDSFFLTHEKDCRRSGANYIAEKDVLCYKNPLSSNKFSPIEKGTEVCIGYTYQANFETWGVIYLISNKDVPIAEKEGWVKIRDLKFSEDTTSFFWEYKKNMGKIQKGALRRTLEEVQGSLKKELVMWSYPCSGKIVGRLSKEEYPDQESVFQDPTQIYQDQEKRYWKIYVNHEMKEGRLSYAICLSDPENDQIAKEITLTKPYAGGKYGRWLVAIPIGIVICILMVGVIIFRVRRRLRMKKMAEDVLK